MSKNIYATLGIIPDIGNFKIYSDRKNNLEKASSLVSSLIEEKHISLPEKVGVVILQNNSLKVFVWDSSKIDESTYKTTKDNKTKQTENLKSSPLMKRIREYEKKGWKFYKKNKNEKAFNIYLNDFIKGCKKVENN